MAKPAKTTYLREWRKFRHLTQAQVVGRLELFDDDKLPSTAASLSRIETGEQPYGQRILEALAFIYDCTSEQLLGHNPDKEGRIIDLLPRLTERQLRQAEAVIEALINAG